MASVTDPGELSATIIREGIAKGLLSGKRPVQITSRFQELFADLIGQLEAPEVLTYVEQVLEAYPKAEKDHRVFLGAFVSRYEEVSSGSVALELLMDSVSDIQAKHYLMLRTVLGLAALVIHRRRFPGSMDAVPL